MTLHFLQDLFSGYHMNAVYLCGSSLRNFRHEQDLEEVLVTKSFDGRDTLCEEFFCQTAQFC